MVDHGVDHAHAVGIVSRVAPPEEEDLASELLANLFGEIGRTETAVEARDRGVCLLEDRVLSARDREVSHRVQRVTSAHSPAWHYTDDDLGHHADQALDLEDVEPSRAGRVDRVGGFAIGIAVAVAATDALVAAGTKRPAAIFGRRAVAGQQHTPHV